VEGQDPALGGPLYHFVVPLGPGNDVVQRVELVGWHARFNAGGGLASSGAHGPAFVGASSGHGLASDRRPYLDAPSPSRISPLHARSASATTLLLLWRRSGENAYVRRLTFLGVLVGVVLTGCSGSVRPDVSSVPAPSIVRFLPHGYRVVKTYRADLSGGVVPDMIVTSESALRAPGIDLQVLSWSRAMRRWRLTFDARTTQQPSGLVGPEEDSNTFPTGANPVFSKEAIVYGQIGVAFAPLLGGPRDQLVFGGAFVGGASVPGFLAVVNFHDGIGKIIYSWNGVPGLSWHISHNTIRAQSSYLMPGASEAGPYRRYQFALAGRAGRIVEVYDSRAGRPFLGVVVRFLRDVPSRTVVVRTARHGPAAGRLRPGDVILNVENAQAMQYVLPNGHITVLGPGPVSTRNFDISEAISSFKAGQTARLLIQRGTKRLTVRVRLGSAMSPAASAIKTPITKGFEEAL